MRGGFFNRLFKNEEPRTVQEGDKLIQEVFGKLIHDSSYQDLKFLISKRQTAFTTQINSVSYQQPFIDAYVHFAQSLKDYIENPGNVYQHIKTYHNSTYYYHVGGMNGKWSYSLADKVADYLLKLSLLLVVAAVVASPFNLGLAVIFLAVALSLMATTLLYSYAVTGENIKKVQAEEIDLFLVAQKMIDPENVDKQEPEENSFLQCC